MQIIKESGEFMKKPIRILHVLQRMEAGGTQALLMNLYRNIDRSKVQFDFLVEYPNKYFYDDEIISLGGKVYYSNVRIDKKVFKFEKLLKRILKENDYSEILEAVNENLLRKYRINLSEINGKHPSEVIDLIYENALKDYEEKLEDIPEEVRDEFEKAISLRVIDNYWMEHISTMSHLRDGIGLRGYANTSPLQAYTMEGYQLFDEMLARINKDISVYLLKSEIRQNIERKQVAKNTVTNDSKDHAKVQKKSTKVGRNDLCPCGSGKKYKNCCGK